MKTLLIASLLAGSAALAACATVAPAPVAVAAAGVCGSYGYIDVNNDGFISGDEWNTYRTRSYGDWDVNHDGRISQSEFEGCYRGGGFYRTSYYNPDYWNYYWRGFDANGDGYLTSDEYWSTSSWSTIDRNHNGRIDSDEWVWWTP
ncbi:MAG TPA: hypothetical protein VM145_00280 [Sphingomicrobium sp.]|nr:hypothetical protein [Sphingomicrobium sp.]